MAGEEYAVTLEWRGPVKVKNAASFLAQQVCDDEQFWCRGLYIAVGRHKPFLWPQRRKIQYVGESVQRDYRVDRDTHHHLCKLTSQSDIWFGSVRSKRDNQDTNSQHHDQNNDSLSAEKALAFSLPGMMNRDHRNKIPKATICIRNKWFDLGGNEIGKRPHSDWPDIVDFHFDGGVETGLLSRVWLSRSGKGRVATTNNLKSLEREKHGRIAKWILSQGYFKPKMTVPEKYGQRNSPVCRPHGVEKNT